MNRIEQRYLIYAALLLVAATTAVFLGWPAGLWTLLQMACVIELIYWLGRRANRHRTRLLN